jgi:Zn-dependent M16 (insulinase) family peptidase
METSSSITSEEQIDGSKLLHFSKLDTVVKPESRGLNEFYYNYTDSKRSQYRLDCLAVTKDDIVNVARTYLDEPLIGGRYSKVIFGNQKEEEIKKIKEAGWKVESFIAENAGPQKNEDEED